MKRKSLKDVAVAASGEGGRGVRGIAIEKGQGVCRRESWGRMVEKDKMKNKETG
jgi:hypothetical protein